VGSAPFEKNSGQPTDIFAFEALSVTSTATAFTAATYDPVAVGDTSSTPAIVAHVSIEGGGCRWRADGTNPTASVGALLNDGDELTVWGTRDIKSIRFIATGGTVTANTHYAR
jgi:hypothetical protein